MIPRKKDINQVPTSLSSQECMDSLEDIIKAQPNERSKLINSKFYNSSDVHQALRDIYGKKCAYCEAPEDEPEIEHYRPKGALNGRKHSGYYWLCYEWSNLLPACHDCNKKGAKGNFFPIRGVEASIVMNGNLPDFNENLITSLNLYYKEDPLLLNPEIPGFNPFDYFEFDSQGFIKCRVGLVQNGKKHARAKNSIMIYELDRYKIEIEYRKVEIRRIHKLIKLLFFQYLNEELTEKGFKRHYFFILEDIKSKSDKSKPYSFFWNYVYTNFNQVYLTGFFKPKQRAFFFSLTNEFKRLNP